MVGLWSRSEYKATNLGDVATGGSVESIVHSVTLLAHP